MRERVSKFKLFISVYLIIVALILFVRSILLTMPSYRGSRNLPHEYSYNGIASLSMYNETMVYERRPKPAMYIRGTNLSLRVYGWYRLYDRLSSPRGIKVAICNTAREYIRWIAVYLNGRLQKNITGSIRPGYCISTRVYMPMYLRYSDGWPRRFLVEFVSSAGGYASFVVNAEPVPALLWSFQGNESLMPPTIGDIDNDGESEIVVAGGNITYCLDYNWISVSHNLESPHPYPYDYDNTWVITCPGAEAMRVHFSYIEVVSGRDFVFIMDAEDDLIVRYTGHHYDFWTPEVPGDTIKIRLWSLGSPWEPTDNGLVIDAYAYKRPMQMPWMFDAQNKITVAPLLADVDGDQRLEVIICSENSTLFCINASGYIKWSFTMDSPTYALPTIADMDHDNNGDIIVGSHNGTIYIINGTGALVQNFTVGSETYAYKHIYGHIVISDLEGDGCNEIFIVATSATHARSKLYCINNNGTERWGFDTGYGGVGPYQWYCISPPAIADVNADGAKEVIVNSPEGVKCFAYNGTELWNLTLRGYTAPTIADVDGDGSMEILLSAGDPERRWWGIYCLDGSGSIRWEHIAVSGGPGARSSPSIFDINNDGKLEVMCIFQHCCDRFLTCVNCSGRWLWSQCLTSDVVSTPIIADVDNDGELEALLSIGQELKCLYIGIGKGVHWPMGGGGLSHAGIYVYPLIDIAINITVGWNLISFPFEPLNNSISGVFSEKLSLIKAIYGFEGGEWLYWLENAPNATLTSMNQGKGYWVLAKDGFNLTVRGRIRTPLPSLCCEWNLIGPISCSPLPVHKAVKLSLIHI